MPPQAVYAVESRRASGMMAVQSVMAVLQRWAAGDGGCGEPSWFRITVRQTPLHSLGMRHKPHEKSKVEQAFLGMTASTTSTK